jgi:hypothetical protein
VPDLSTLIREYVDEVSPSVTVRDVEALLERGSTVHAPRVHPPTHRRRAAFSIGAGAVALAIALLLQFLPTSGPHPSSDAAAVLAQAAATAAAQPAASGPKRGQYLYYQITQALQIRHPEPAGARQFTFVSIKTIETWVAPNGSGRQRIETEKGTLLVPSDKAAWVAAGSPAGGYPVGTTDTEYPTTKFPGGGPIVRGAHGEYYLSYLDSSKFPTQPAALQQYMNRYFGVTGGSTTTFLLAGDALQVGASPALRSAIFQLIDHLPGIKVIGPTKDVAGRDGVGVAIDGSGNRYILVFNPKTSAVLGEKILANETTTHLGETVPKGTLVGFETFDTTGIASSISEFPNGASAPPYLHEESAAGGSVAYSGTNARNAG